LIFDEINQKQKKDLVFKCQISFTEIYKENVYDLLDPLKKEKSIEQWVPVQVYEGESPDWDCFRVQFGEMESSADDLLIGAPQLFSWGVSCYLEPRSVIPRVSLIKPGGRVLQIVKWHINRQLDHTDDLGGRDSEAVQAAAESGRSSQSQRRQNPKRLGAR
jgi:hypothetical protein